MKNKYQFFEIVRVTPKHKRKQFAGKEGAILGMAQNDQGQWEYSITFTGTGENYGFYEDELEPTGKMDKRESFYDGSSVTVKVDPKTGEGYITGYHDPKSN
jgi:hypothetical protein